jgi:acetylglutamate kinase
MKVVVKVTRLTENQEDAWKLGRATACLVHDGHSVAIIHGHHHEDISNCALATIEQCRSCTDDAIVEIERENRNMVGVLNRAGAAALGLRVGDGATCDLRKARCICNRESVELVRMNARWIDCICRNQGVPVISNLALASWGEQCLLDADNLAADCAKAWRADALIYLTTVEGVRSADGATMRWLDISCLDRLKNMSEITHDMLAKLRACGRAIESGVGRVRILPLAHIDCLPVFFSSRIDAGTEVINLQGGMASVEGCEHTVLHAQMNARSARPE